MHSGQGFFYYFSIEERVMSSLVKGLSALFWNRSAVINVFKTSVVISRNGKQTFSSVLAHDPIKPS